MFRLVISVFVCCAIVVTVTPTARADEPAIKAPAKTSTAWTLEQATHQLSLNPQDPYLQYVALQLARNEGKSNEVSKMIDQLNGRGRRGRGGPDRNVDLFAVFTGALAVQESLQLDTMRAVSRDGENRMGNPKYETINVSALVGPTVKSHPWGKMLAAQNLAGNKPEVSELAMCVPEDQYFVLFSSVGKLLEVSEAGDLWGAHMFSQAARSAQTHQTTKRLKNQLAIQTDPLSRPFYDMVVDEVAITGSDLDFRVGSDITLLFKIKQPEVFRLRMDSFLQEAQKSGPDATRTTGKIQGVDYVHVGTPDRAIHVFSAYPRPDLHVRSNSKAALESVLRTIDGKQHAKPLGESTEFKYIRTLMPRGAQQEHGFVYLSDPFIRRVVGPELKLTQVRRMYCYNHLRMIGHASTLYRTQYGRPPASLEELFKTGCAPGMFDEGKLRCPCGGKYTLSADRDTGICSHHGHARYMTPCREIPLERVTRAEASQYQEFVERYNQYWRTFFDPIAVRIQVTPKQYRAETIILPLIDNSIYSGMAMALGGEPASLDGLPVPKRNIFSVAVKLNKKNLMEQAGLKPPGPGTDKLAEEKANLLASVNNLKQLALAMHNYHDARRIFPLVANFDKQGRPLLSWRVHLLPYLGQNELYKQFHLDEPWDSERNKKLIKRMPHFYVSPGRKARKPGTTTYVVPVGMETVFTGTKSHVAFRDIRDGTSNTIMLLDAAEKHAVPWTKPNDWTYDPAKIRDVVFERFGETGLVSFCDGSVRGLPKDIQDESLKALFTRGGNEPIGQIAFVPIGISRRSGPFGIRRLIGDNLDERELYKVLTEGVGDQVGMHVYDASPMFDFNLTGFMGDMLRGFGGGRGRIDSNMLYVSFLVSSLNAPVYISVPVKDTEIVDGFLDQFDSLLAQKARQPQRSGWFGLDYDFYRMPLAGDEPSIRSFNVQFGPVKWRLFFARIGDALYIASKPFILQDLADLHKQQTSPAAAESERDQGPRAHAMVRIRPEHWKQVLPTFQLGWSEASRQSCLNNLGPLSSAARAGISSGKRPAGTAQISRAADALYGVHFFCPDGGRYQLSPHGPEVVCSIHGTAHNPRQMPRPTSGSPIDRLMKDFGGITAALTFMEDGLHAVVTIQRK